MSQSSFDYPDSAELLRGTLSALPDAIAILNNQGGIVAFNPLWCARAERLGRSPHDGVAELVSPQTSGTESEALRRVLSGELESAELEIERKSGADPWWEGMWLRRFHHPASDHTVAVYRDISRRKQAERAKSEFLANVSHEIRSPMTAILGFAELLSENQLPETERKHALRTIVRYGEHLLALINDLLDLSKIDAGKMRIEIVSTRLSDVLEDVVSLMNGPAREKTLTLGADVDPNLSPIVRTDPMRLKQILINLIGNAIKFTEQGGVHLEVRSAAEAEQKIEIDVVDSGIGMTREEASSLFQAFAQADPSTARRFGGTGLGLLISQRLARLLGGDVWIVSSVPGAGTRFRVVLPV